MSTPTQTCSRCTEPIDQTRPHHVLSVRIERVSPNGRDVVVIEHEDIEFRHLTCGPPTKHSAAERAATGS